MNCSRAASDTGENDALIRPVYMQDARRTLPVTVFSTGELENRFRGREDSRCACEDVFAKEVMQPDKVGKFFQLKSEVHEPEPSLFSFGSDSFNSFRNALTSMSLYSSIGSPSIKV